MKSLTNLLGYLGKSGTKTNTPEAGDTKVTVPGVLMPTIQIPYPTQQLFTAPLPGGSNTPTNSWIFAHEITFNGAVNAIIAILGPGLWDVTVALRKRIQGAGSDNTSSLRIEMLNATTNASVVLARITNGQTVQEDFQTRFTILSSSEDLFQFAEVGAVGAGTGTNLGHVLIIATRLF